MIDAQNIIDFYYPPGDPARAILLRHSIQVRDKALALRETCPLRETLDPALVSAGAMLHDLGIRCCHAPDLGCFGSRPYLAHGIAGAALLREFAAAHGLALEPLARICERHTGTGLTAAEIRARALPLPEADYLPETLEEKLICFADKFFSKSGDFAEKTLADIRGGVAKFGPDNLARFDALAALFMP